MKVNVNELDPMIGVVLVEADGWHFKATDGTVFEFYHSQSCCEQVDLYDVVGDLSDLLDTPVLSAEEITSDPPEGGPVGECDQWTFYRFSTGKGTVTARWYGTSNGYYSTGVSFRAIKARN